MKDSFGVAIYLRETVCYTTSQGILFIRDLGLTIYMMALELYLIIKWYTWKPACSIWINVIKIGLNTRVSLVKDKGKGSEQYILQTEKDSQDAWETVK